MKNSGWIKGVVLFTLATVLVFFGVFVSYYWRAKAASYEIMSQQNDHQQGDSQGSQVIKNTVNTTMVDHPVSTNQDQQNKENTNVQDQQPVSVVTPSVTPVQEKPAEQATAKQNTPPKPPQQENPQPVIGGKRIIYLTFDDGPEIFSKDIIALLEKYHYKATFFMLDPNIRKYPDSAKLMVQTGEGVGLHGVTHDVKKFYASADSVIGELTQDRNTLREITGVNSFIMRTPYGSFPYMKEQYKQAVYANGYLMWDWNIDSKDWYYKDSRYVNSVIDQLNKKANYRGPIVILLHEKRDTLACLPQLLDYLSKHNFQSVAINSSIPPLHF